MFYSDLMEDDWLVELRYKAVVRHLLTVDTRSSTDIEYISSVAR